MQVQFLNIYIYIYIYIYNIVQYHVQYARQLNWPHVKGTIRPLSKTQRGVYYLHPFISKLYIVTDVVITINLQYMHYTDIMIPRVYTCD